MDPDDINIYFLHSETTLRAFIQFSYRADVGYVGNVTQRKYIIYPDENGVHVIAKVRIKPTNKYYRNLENNLRFQSAKRPKIDDFILVPGELLGLRVCQGRQGRVFL